LNEFQRVYLFVAAAHLQITAAAVHSLWCSAPSARWIQTDHRGERLKSALATYSRQIKARGEKMPESVRLDELFRRG
jgi:hypothetical protein